MEEELRKYQKQVASFFTSFSARATKLWSHVPHIYTHISPISIRYT